MIKHLKLIKVVIFFAIIFWYGLFLSHKIDLTTADLGRHLKNGEIILNGNSNQKWEVLHTNFYSYTLTSQAFINHHWLTGVVFFLLYKLVGFSGLSVIYLALVLGAFIIVFDIARKLSNFWISSLISIILMPLITNRSEVRPEGFTYLLSALFLWILYRCIYENRNSKLLWILPLLMLLWVNLHIGFVFGFLILFSFCLKEMISFLQHKNNNFFKLIYISALSLIFSLINPNFIKGTIYPLKILSNYGYLIVENQSIFFLENLGFTNGQHFILFKLAVIGGLVIFIFVLLKRIKKINISLLILFLSISVLSTFAIRNFPLFALFSIPFISSNIYLLLPKEISTQAKYNFITIGLLIFAVCFYNSYSEYSIDRNALGFGLLPEVEASATFFKEKNITGPIFNNYDIGGYLIFAFYPEKIFVDNRPEAYGPEFFKNTYIPMQENEKMWNKFDNKYKFNSIFFSHRDYTPWGQKFLVARINDDKWAPVFVDRYNIIFLRRNEKNKNIIKSYEVSKDKFKVSKNL